MRADDAARGPAARTALLLAMLGTGLSAYLTVEHFSAHPTLACPESATVNCLAVTTSRWAELAGVPVAVLGLAYFVVMTGLVAPAAWRRPALDRVRTAAGFLGCVMVVYLVWAELFGVGALCLWCTAVHVCTLGLFAAVQWHTATLAAPAGR